MAKWALKRDLFLGGSRFRQMDGGTEVPDHLTDSDGKVWKIVPANKERKYKDDEIPMPRDAELYDEAKKKQYPGRADKRIMGTAAAKQPKPVALSQLPKHNQAQEAASNSTEDDD